jgi:spore cortex biosynthesis protein YabQ
MEILFGRDQWPVILSFFVCGMISGILSDIFTVKRRYFKENRLILFVDDFLFMIICAVIVVFNSYSFNDGNMKWYEIPVMFFGFVIYKKTVSRLILKTVCFVIDYVIKLFKLLFLPLKIVKAFVLRSKERFELFVYTARMKRRIAKPIRL